MMELQKRAQNIPLFLLSGLLFGCKTYIAYRFVFNIQIDTILQELIILINPFISSIIFFSISIWFQNTTHQRKFIFYSAIIGSVIIYFNLIFYRSFTDFLTIPQLFQMSNFADLTTSILTLIKWYDLFLFIDLLLIWMLSKNVTFKTYSKKDKVFAVVISLLLISSNFLLAEIERPQLLQRAFDREYLVKNIGVFYYHIYDIFMNSKLHTQRVLAEGHEIEEIKDYVKNKQRQDDMTTEIFGIAKNRNIIFISAESLQSFVIQNEVHGEEITPFLNQLVSDSNTFYFENFYHQTAQGKTSDSEFLVETSLYPITSGAVFFTHSQNEYNSLAKILKKADYHSYVFHANDETFWNRNQMYESLGIDYFYDVSHYDVNEENTVGWGLKDKEFFSQSIEYLQTLHQPFYAKFITLTNHFPFELTDEDRSIAPFDSSSNTLNHYFPTVRYTDEAIEQFFNQLKMSGLYEDSIIIIMGDHDGISANHHKAMAEYLNVEEISLYDHIQLQRVPLFIHIPGMNEGKVISDIGGQIDIKPTLLHLLGIHHDGDIYFGRNLFSGNENRVISFINGNFVSEQYIYTNETCFDRQTGEIIAQVEMFNEENPCNTVKEEVEQELIYSNQIIYGDLLRFVEFD